MEHQLHQRDALDVLRLDVLDAGDVEEVVLVVVRQVAFHLRRIHAAVRLRDVDRRRAELREDVDLHLPDRHDRRQSATEMTATRIVIGRRMAVNTNHMNLRVSVRLTADHGLSLSRNGVRSPRACAAASSARHTPSRATASSASACASSRCASATSVDAGEAVLIAGARLPLAGGRRLALDRRVPGDLRRRLHSARAFASCVVRRLNRPIVVRAARPARSAPRRACVR